MCKLSLGFRGVGGWEVGGGYFTTNRVLKFRNLDNFPFTGSLRVRNSIRSVSVSESGFPWSSSLRVGTDMWSLWTIPRSELLPGVSWNEGTHGREHIREDMTYTDRIHWFSCNTFTTSHWKFRPGILCGTETERQRKNLINDTFFGRRYNSPTS